MAVRACPDGRGVSIVSKLDICAYATIWSGPIRALTLRVKGGAEVGSRVRIAAAGLLIAACALFTGGIGDAVAYASPVQDSAGADDGDGSRPASAHRGGAASRPRPVRVSERSANPESRKGKPQGRP